MIERVLDWFERRSAPTEEDTEYNGFLSYAGEFHALTIGLSVGASSAVLETPEVAATIVLVSLGVKGKDSVKNRLESDVVHEIRRESWYSCGGVGIGYGVGLLGKTLGLL